MKRKLFTLLGLGLLASSSMFAGWGVSVGFGGRYYAPPPRVFVARGPAYVAPHYWAPAPYVAVAPAPYVETYVGPPPFYGAVWVAGRWCYGPAGRYWARGYWRHR